MFGHSGWIYTHLCTVEPSTESVCCVAVPVRAWTQLGQATCSSLHALEQRQQELEGPPEAAKGAAGNLLQLASLTNNFPYPLQTITM